MRASDVTLKLLRVGSAIGTSNVEAKFGISLGRSESNLTRINPAFPQAILMAGSGQTAVEVKRPEGPLGSGNQQPAAQRPWRRSLRSRDGSGLPAVLWTINDVSIFVIRFWRGLNIPEVTATPGTSISA